MLIVDDFDDQRELYATALRFAGFDAEEAGDGQEALTLVADHQPNVIVLDLAMPPMDGWETCRRLRADPRMADVTIIALTAHALPRVRESAVRAGCDAYLTTPCSPDTLVATVRDHVARRSQQAS